MEDEEKAGGTALCTGMIVNQMDLVDQECQLITTAHDGE